MNDGRFLVARVAPDSLGETLEWLGADESPFQPVDPLDFLSSAETAAVYEQPSGAARTLLTIARANPKALLAVAGA